MPYNPKLRLFMKLWKTVTKAADMTLCSTKLVADEGLEGEDETTGMFSDTPGQVCATRQVVRSIRHNTRRLPVYARRIPSHQRGNEPKTATWNERQPI